MSDKKNGSLSPGKTFSDDDFENEILSTLGDVSGLLRKTAKAYLKAGHLCAQWASICSQEEMCKRLQIRPDKLSKFIAIGKDTRLQAEANLPYLPAAYSILYEISLLSDHVFEAAIMLKEIHPEVQRTQISALRKKSLPADLEQEEGSDHEEPSEQQEISEEGHDAPLVPKQPKENDQPAGAVCASTGQQLGEVTAVATLPVVSFVMPDVPEEQRNAIIAEISVAKFRTFALEPMNVPATSVKE